MRLVARTLVVLLILIAIVAQRVAAQGATVRPVVVPDAQILSISPDGKWLLAEHPLPPEAGFVGPVRALQESGEEIDEDAPKLCVYALASLAPRSCTPPGAFEDGPGRISGGISWAPDGDALVFSEGSLPALVDGDLWRLDAGSGELTNLTDDGWTGPVPYGDEPVDQIAVDTQPTFSPDGAAIAFARGELVEDGSFVFGVAVLELESGAIATVAPLATDPFEIISGAIAWSPDGNAIWYTTSGIEPANLGLFHVAVDGSQPERITPPATERDQEIMLIEVDPAGERALVAFPQAMNRLRGPFFGIVDLATGALAPIEQTANGKPDVVYAAAFAADGRIVLVERAPDKDDAERSYRIVAYRPEDGQAEVLADGVPPYGFSPYQLRLTLLPDGSVAYPNPRDDGSDGDTMPWTIVAFGEQPATPEPAAGIAPGATAVVTEETSLRATPSVDGVATLTVPAGTALVVIDVSVEVDGIVWWPVREPESGALGYVPQAYLTVADG